MKYFYKSFKVFVILIFLFFKASKTPKDINSSIIDF